MTATEFIEKASKVHEGKYNYSKISYVNSHTKVCIICPKHGEFWQLSYCHLKGQGCKKCAVEEQRKNQRNTTEDFIRKAKLVHGDKYDYSKVKYINSKTKVCITCPEHGEFWQIAGAHLNGAGCKKCAGTLSHEKQSYTTEDFIRRSKDKFGDKFTYDKCIYVNSKTKLCVTCKKHGDFYVTPSNHFRKTGGCKLCQSEATSKRSKKPFEEFVQLAQKKFGGNFFYDEKTYNENSRRFRVVCNEHGEFWTDWYNFLHSIYGCPLCNEKVTEITGFLEKAKKVHGERYDYSNVKFTRSVDKIEIICKNHGAFYQSVNSHLSGHGCPVCKISSLETDIRLMLADRNIKYLYQHKMPGMGRLTFDFYLPDYNIAIECQGRQHFEPVKAFGGIDEFKKIIERDGRKKDFCKQNGIKLLYYTNIISEKTENMLKTTTAVLNEIQNYG